MTQQAVLAPPEIFQGHNPPGSESSRSMPVGIPIEPPRSQSSSLPESVDLLSVLGGVVVQFERLRRQSFTFYYRLVRPGLELASSPQESQSPPSLPH